MMETKEKRKETMKPDVMSQIAQWKTKYKHVFCYAVETEEGETVECYFRQPDRRILSAATVNAKGDPMRYNEIVLKNCMLDDDKSLLEDDSIFFGLSQKVDELVNAKVGELKKL